MIKFHIWLTTHQGLHLHAGELVTSAPDARGALNGQFRYSPEYLENRSSFPLDPIHLPLSPGIYEANRPHSGVHGVFEDSLPDDWGRGLLIKRYNLPRHEQRIPHLLRCLENSIGALSYTEYPEFIPQTVDVDSNSLSDLQHQAERYEHNASLPNDNLPLLLQAGSSPGGARPKALVRDGEQSFIAKFPSRKDAFDIVALEAATMELARSIGLETAATRIVPCGNHKALIVERFDIGSHPNGRNHMISMQSLLGADGFYNMSYRDMADVIRTISSSPVQDLKRMFKQMVFNVAVGNTDDHLKNFCMLHTQNGWTLSPAYDLLPNIGHNQEHVLRTGYSNMAPDRKTLLTEAKHFGIKRQNKANSYITDVLSKVEKWESVYRSNNVPKQDITTLRPDIEKRLLKLT